MLRCYRRLPYSSRMHLIVPAYLSSLILYQPLTSASTSYMPDIGGGMHHMYHSRNLSYDPNGITYSGDCTRLRPEQYAAFQFPSRFFLSVDARINSVTLLLTKYETIFSKKGFGISSDLTQRRINDHP